MGAQNLILGKVSDTTTSQYHPLGMLYEQGPDEGDNRESGSGTVSDRGRRVWIYVYNDSGSAIPKGTVCMPKSGTTTYNVKASTTSLHPSLVVGVAQNAIPNGSYGWLLREGVGLVTADTGGLSANTAIVPGDAVAGTADNVAARTDASFGWCIVAATATNTAYCRINCIG